jgi:hypothetical protein
MTAVKSWVFAIVLNPLVVMAGPAPALHQLRGIYMLHRSNSSKNAALRQKNLICLEI